MQKCGELPTSKHNDNFQIFAAKIDLKIQKMPKSQ